jgi:M6 family metalloprotease-like protein
MKSLLLTGLIVMCAITSPRGSRAGGSQEVLAKAGSFLVLWGDRTPVANLQTKLKYFLVDDRGEWTELKLADDFAERLGSPLAFNRKRVRIVGEQMSALDRSIKVRDLALESPQITEASGFGPEAVIGTKRWITILCRFSDSTSSTPRPDSYFDGLMSNTYPGMGHYWAESSYGSINLIGSAVVGWYNLPRPRSYYVYGATPHFDFDRAVTDATAVADADVYFPDFYGINFIFNQELDGFSWGGGAAVSKDGLINQVFGATYLPPSGYANQSRVAHEMGHGFGLPHSSGPYAATYDSQWDPMSALGTCSPGDLNYGCVGVNTVSCHKDKLGWIPPGRKYVAVAGSSATINVERLDLPISSNNYLMAQIPMGNSLTRYYTVEARLFAGYDSQVPGQAIVIHDVDTGRGDRAAQVVDIDNNGDPNDAGAMWLPGETFSDSVNHIQITVNSMGASSFSVTIANTCASSISSNIQSYTPGGGTGSVNVITDASCPWQASSNVAWVTITSGVSGLGNGTVSYSVTANTGPGIRTGTLSIAGQTFTVSQTASPSPATVPVLLVDETSGRAAALDSVTSLRDPLAIFNSLNFSLDHRTRVTLLAVNMDLLPGENISVVSAQAEDLVGVYPLTVEFVGKVPNFDWLTQIVVKLPDALANAGDVQVSVSLRGVPSNRVIVRTQ